MFIARAHRIIGMWQGVSGTAVEARMKETEPSKFYVEPSWRGLFHVSGILLVMVGAGGFVSWRLGSYLYSSGIPSNPTAYLQLISQHQFLANLLWSNWILGDFLLIAPTIAVYLILRRYNMTLALFGTLLSMFYIIYDASITELNSLTLVSLSQGYATATTDAARASYVGAATYGYAALPLETVLSFGVGAAGWLMWSLVMSKSFFGRRSAILGIVVNAMGVIGSVSPVVASSFALGLLNWLTAPLTAFWFIIIGTQLYRYSGHPAVGAMSSVGSAKSTAPL